jgi:vitamin B12 transporter
MAPTFNDLYYPDVGFFRGNPDLRPERSRTSELGIEGGVLWRWSVNAFRTEVDDLIVYDATSRRSENVDTARIDGAEASLATTLAGIDAELSATVIDAQDAATGNELPRRPSTSARLALARDLGPVRLGTAISYHGDAYDDRGNTTELDAYTVVDFSAAWRIAADWTLRGELTNAFDEEYQTADTYNTAGRAVFVSLHWQPQTR